MKHCNKTTFIDSIRELDYPDMLQRTCESGAAQERARGRDQDSNYTRFLSGIAFWLQNGHRPGGLSLEDLRMLRPLAESLIAKGQMTESALDLFIQADREGDS